MRENRDHSASPARRGAADNGGEERRGGIEIKSARGAPLARSAAAETKVEEEKRRKEIKEGTRVREKTIVWSQAG